MRRTLILLLLLALAPVARAECPRVLAELEQLREQIDRSRDALAECDVDQVDGLVEQAGHQLREAERYAAGNECRRAATHVLAGRSLLEKARDLCRDRARLPEQAEMFLARTDDELARMREHAGSASPECRRLLRLAFDQQEKAWRQFRADKLRLAIGLSAGARRTADSARRCARGGPDAAVRIERELADTDRLLAGLAERLGPDAPPEARELARRAEDLQARARRRAAGDGDTRAVLVSRHARLLAWRALALDDRLEPEGIGRMITATRDLLQPARDAAVDGGDETLRRLVAEADRRLDTAETALVGGDPRRALVEARAAAGLALEAVGRTGPGLDDGP
jgi:hypothetical protein